MIRIEVTGGTLVTDLTVVTDETVRTAVTDDHETLMTLLIDEAVATVYKCTYS